MATKKITEVIEIESGAVLNALQESGWPVSSVDKVEAVDVDGKTLGAFGGLRFTYVKEERVKQSPGAD